MNAALLVLREWGLTVPVCSIPEPSSTSGHSVGKMTVGLELTHLAKEKTKTAHNVVFGAIMSVDQMRKINTLRVKKTNPKTVSNISYFDNSIFRHSAYFNWFLNVLKLFCIKCGHKKNSLNKLFSIMPCYYILFNVLKSRY